MRNRVLLAVFGYLCLHGVLGWSGEPDLTQEQVLAAIQKAGGRIERDKANPTKPVVKVTFGCHSTATDTELAHLKSLPDVQEVFIGRDSITDKGLAELKGLPRLHTLTVMRARITDQGLEHLKGLTSLRKVRFNNTAVTENGAKELAKALPDAKIIWHP